MLLGLRQRLPAWPLYLGCLLPDLIDKPLYYGLLALHRSSFITGSRTFGHTGLFLIALLLAAAASGRAALWALAAGTATHFALDIATELATGSTPESSIWLAIFFPACGARFPVARFTSLLEHLSMTAENAVVVVGEVAGAAILLHALWREHHSS